MEKLFPVPLYIGDVDNFDQIQSEIQVGIDNTNFRFKEEWGSTHEFSDPTFHENFLLKHNCQSFLNELPIHLERYMQKQLPMKGAWAARFRKHMYGHIHDHFPHSVAGVYYFKTEGSDGKLFFRSDLKYYGRQYITPREGMLLLFPGSLKHGITTNTTDIDRISISFDLGYE